MKTLVATLLCVTTAFAQDGSYLIDSRGVEVEQGLIPSQRLYDTHKDFSEDFKRRSQEMARQYSQDQTVYNDPNPNYAWAYAVDAKSTGDRKSAQEERRGDVVIGQYSVVEPNGLLRTVDYSVAPGTGFQATVTKEPVDGNFQNPTEYRQQNQFQSRQYDRNQQDDRNQNQYSQNYDNRQNQQRFQNQQNYQRNSQNQFQSGNDNNRLSYSQDYGYNRNFFDNHNQFNNQRNLDNRGQYSQRYGNADRQYKYDRSQQSQFEDQDNYNRYQYNRQSSRNFINQDLQHRNNENQFANQNSRYQQYGNQRYQSRYIDNQRENFEDQYIGQQSFQRNRDNA